MTTYTLQQVLEADVEEKKDVVVAIPTPRKKFTPKEKVLFWPTFQTV